MRGCEQAADGGDDGDGCPQNHLQSEDLCKQVPALKNGTRWPSF